MTYYDQNALKLCHAFWRERLRPGMTCVDATAGRGRDAEVLCLSLIHISEPTRPY